MRKTLRTAALCSAFIPLTATAHPVGLSRGEYSLRGGSLRARMVFARGEVEPHISSLLDRIEVTSGGVRCPGVLDTTGPVEGDGVAIEAHWTCPAEEAAVTVRLTLLDDLPFGHRHLAQIGGEVTMATRGNDSFEVRSGGGPPAAAGFLAMFRMGVEHILTGWDHLVFLFGLILVGGRVRSLVGVITAFTLGHSLTLALATLGVIAPGPRLVEPAIALSIAYVGVENFFVSDVARRWRITLPFGLIHGFGFASALRQIEIPRPSLPLALASFNLGVEVGQLAILTLFLPLVLWLKRQPRFGERGVQAASALIVAAGAVWFVQRAFFS